MTNEELISDFRSLADRREEFVKRFLKATPDPWQSKALAALDKGSSIAVKSGHGVGKTAFLSWVVLHGLCCFPHIKIPCTAPTQHQLSDLLWTEIQRWAYGSGLMPLFDFTAQRITCKGHPEWYAAARSCSKPENLAGFHAPHIIYVADEASGIPDSTFQVVEGALTAPGSQLVMCGNPTRRSGYFYNAFAKDMGFVTGTVSSLECQRVDKSFGENIALRWGRDSDAYRVRVLGEFPSREAQGFFSPALVSRAMEGWETAPCEGEVQLGIDVARYGNDKTVFCVRQGCKVVFMEDRMGLSVPEAAARASELAREWQPSAILVDDTGVGGGVTDLLRLSETGILVKGISFGGSGNDRYANTASLMAGELKERLVKGTCFLPPDAELMEQLTNRRYSLTAKGLLQLERKEDMKRRGLASPDKSDAVFLAFFEPGTGFVTLSQEGSCHEYYTADSQIYW